MILHTSMYSGTKFTTMSTAHWSTARCPNLCKVITPVGPSQQTDSPQTPSVPKNKGLDHEFQIPLAKLFHFGEPKDRFLQMGVRPRKISLILKSLVAIRKFAISGIET